MPQSSPRPAYLDAAKLDVFLRRALQADIGTGDITSLATVDAGQQVSARFVVRGAGVVAGLGAAQRTLELADPATTVSWARSDGEAVMPGDILGLAHGNARAILQGERLALNLLQRMSGIATATRTLTQALHPVRVRDTRKTAPGLSLLDKWAVMTGGGENHRLGLYDRMLIKDNHIAAAGGIRNALALAAAYRKRHAPNICIEVEVRTHVELQEALAAGGFDELLLDNMVTIKASGVIDVSKLAKAVDLVNGRCTTEASGNVSIHSARAIATTGVDYASCGALTHSVSALDIALDFLQDYANGY